MKALSIFVVLALLAGVSMPMLSASSAEQAPAVQAGVPNPIHESTREEAEKAAGQFLPAMPEGAENLTYSYIDAPADDPEGTVIAQAHFELSGVRYVVRVTSATEIKDISGVYEDWAVIRQVPIGINDGLVMYTQGGPGVALWYDLRMAALYCLSMDDGVTLTKLMALSGDMSEWEQEEPPVLPGGEATNSWLVASLGFAEEADSQKIADALGFELKAPAGAEQVKFYLYPGTLPRGAVRYLLEGTAYIHWALPALEPNPSATYIRWQQWDIKPMGQAEALLSFNPGGEGLISWFDEAGRVSHAVAVLDGASVESLLAAAKPVI